jgi:uncharacterized protein YndB with AHSA1/START domain
MFWIAIVVLLVLALLAYAASRPDQFRIERRTRINATPDRIFPFLTDFKRWAAWSPWEAIDPNLTRRYSGAATGKGSVYEWEGNKKAGKGRMEIRETTSPSNVVITLDFIEPWAAHNTTEFTLAPSAGGTDVIWAMYGPSLFANKLMGLFMSMDKLVGKDFERGLANLKQAAESGATATY